MSLLSHQDISFTSQSLSLSVLEYQTAILRDDFEMAEKTLPIVPTSQRNRLARFLEAQGTHIRWSLYDYRKVLKHVLKTFVLGLKEMAMEITTDIEHQFELAIQLKRLDIAFQLALSSHSEYKWKQLADLAFSEWDLELAEQFMKKAKDYSGLLLLYSSSGNVEGLAELASLCTHEGQFNIAFVSYYLLGNTESCVTLLCTSERYAEAAFFARTYAPR